MSEQEILAEIVRRLVAAIDPEKIIRFGSCARGDACPESDDDLLLVAPSSRPLRWRAGSLAQSVNQEGRVLYERTAA